MQGLRGGCVFLMVIALVGCSTLYNPATGRNEFILLNSKTESAIGKNVSADYVQKYPLSRDAGLQQRVQAIGAAIARVSDRQDIQYQYAVVEDKTLNALTLPGGYVYINKGLVDILDDDELAFVLAHETGHVAARHIAKKLQAGMTYQLLLTMAFVGLGGGDASAGTALLQGVDTVYNLISLGYSRTDEYEADRLGATYAYRAGYRAERSISALEKLKKSEGAQGKGLEYLRTHPFVDDRVKALQALLGRVGSLEVAHGGARQ